MKKSLVLIFSVFLITICFFSIQTFASSDVKPGLNVFTGTEEAFDFEGDTSNVVFCDTSNKPASVYADDNGKTVNTVVVREKDGNSKNHAASVDGNKYYFYIDCDFPVIDKDRPVKISYDYILGLGGYQVRTLINYPTTYKLSGIEKASFYITYLSPAMTVETWRNVTHTQTPGAVSNKGDSYYEGGENMEFLSFVNYSGNAQASYFDNLLCVPYYKVSYNLNGGEGNVENEYFLQDGGTTYTLKANAPAIYRNGYTFAGWAKTQDANESDAITTVTVTPGSDITIYAIWNEIESEPLLGYTFENNIKGNADGTISVFAENKTEGYTAVTLYYGNKDGILKGYTPLKTLKFSDGVANYIVGGSKAFPIDATKIIAVFSAEGKENYTYTYNIPEEKLVNAGKEPVLSFYSLSDFHNSESEYYVDNRSIFETRENAIRDIFANKDRYSFVLMNGDNVSMSDVGSYAKFRLMLERFKDEGVPAFFNIGNHEFHVRIDGVETPNLSEGNEEIFLEILDEQEQYLETIGYALDRDPCGWYYSFEVKGIKFIMCATPYPNVATDTCDYEISGEQLEWLERQLFDAEQSNKPVFVLSHIGLGEYIPPSYSVSGGITNANELKAVLNRHANLFFGSAHTHTNINVDFNTVVAGDQTTQFTHYNEGCVAYTYEYDENLNRLGYETDYTVGYCIDIYEDRVVFRGRMFDDVADGDSKYISHATYQIMMPGYDKDLPTLSVNGKTQDGAVLTPKFSKQYDGVIGSYEWFIDGKVVSRDSSYTVEINENTCGKYVALRVTYEDGTYISAVSEKIPGYTVTYDFNGASGVSVINQDVVPDMTFTPVVPAKAPTKPGMYFAGWSVNKNATEPDTTFFADGDMTLYAVFKDGFTITYDVNGGSGTVPESVVVPEGYFTPDIGGSLTFAGKYFVGYADTKDATEPKASVYVTDDTTLYAVYIDEPKWYFNANLSGFKPNNHVTSHSIEDGILYYSNEGASSKDPTFNNSGTSFMAEDYPILRVKLYGENENGMQGDVFDGIFFQSPTSGYTESKTKIPLKLSYKVAEVNGMNILEIKINECSSTSEYKGKISSVRYDPLNYAGLKGHTDYLVFTDKMGVYKADVTVTEENGSVTTMVSDDTVNCTADAVIEKTLLGNMIAVTLTPFDGYEFTTAEDVLALTTINGQKPDRAEVLGDGSAVICKYEKTVIAVGDTDDNSPVASVKIDKTLIGKDFMIALYSGNTLCQLQTVTDANVYEGYIDIVADRTLEADFVRIFAFESVDNISPVCEPFEGDFEFE